MRDQSIDYEGWTYEALREVVRRALAHVAQEGLPSDHYFYITFRTQAPGVEIARELAERYPEEMTIILQHQFWDLEVRRGSFSLGLSFSSVPHKLKIPFAAVTSFADPPAQFGLSFPGKDAADEEAEAPLGPREILPPGSADEKKAAAPAEGSERETEAGAEVVSIDAFRKR